MFICSAMCSCFLLYCFLFCLLLCFTRFFFFNDTATTEIYTLSLHDALPIWPNQAEATRTLACGPPDRGLARSEEHTSELQSPVHLVCRLLLEKKQQPTQ